MAVEKFGMVIHKIHHFIVFSMIILSPEFKSNMKKYPAFSFKDWASSI